MKFRPRGDVRIAATRCALLALGCIAWSAPQAHEHPQAHSHLGLTNQPRTAMIWYRDVVYDASYKDTRYTSLDLYVPDPVKPKMPVLVFVHGGGYNGSDKAYYKDLGHKPGWLTRDMGYIFASVNFRQLPDGGYPASFDDVAKALAWVDDHIAEYGGDPGRIVVLAHATAVQQVGLVATNAAFLKKAGKSLSLIKGVVYVDGAFFDVTGPQSGIVKSILPTADAAQLRAASPLYNVAPGKGLAPTLILYGDEGGATAAQAESMAAALRAAGTRATSIELLGKDHFSANEDIGVPNDAATIAVQRFLESLK